MKRESSEAAAAGLLLSALMLVLLLPLEAAGPVYYRDLSQNFLPLRMLSAALRERGESVRWNPYLGGGVPLAADPNTLLWHPAWLLDRLIEPSVAIKAGIALHLALGAGFLAAFLRRRGASASAATAGAVAFAFSGPVLSLGTLPNLLTAAAWIPPALYFLDRVRVGCRWALPVSVACGAASLIPADPACALALGAGALLAVSAEPEERVGSPAPAAGEPVPSSVRPRVRLPVRPFSLAALFLLLSLSAALAQLLPAWQLVRRSERSLGFAVEEAGKWSLAPFRLPELIVAGWIGDPTSLSPGKYWGASWLETGFPFLLSIYVGLPALALALAGAGAPREQRRERAAGVALAVGGLTLALGRWLPGYAAVVEWVPGAGLFRYPEKFLIPAALGLSVLVALGVDRLASTRPAGKGARRPALRLAIALMAVGLLLGLMAAAPPVAGKLLRPSSEALLGRELSDEAFGRLCRAVLQAAGVASVCGLLLFGFSRSSATPFLPEDKKNDGEKARGTEDSVDRGEKTHPGLRLALAALVCCDLALAAIGPPGEGWLPWSLRLNPTAPAGFLQIRPAVPALPPGEEATVGGWRTYRDDRPNGFEFRRKDDSIAWGFLWDRVTLARSWPAAFGSATAFDQPTDRLLPAEVARAAAIARSGTMGERVRLWSLDSVRFVTSYEPLDDPDLIPIARLEGASRPPLARYENRTALPRARIVELAAILPTAEDALKAALREGFDPARRLVIDAGAEGIAREGAGAAAGEEERTGLTAAAIEGEPKAGRIEEWTTKGAASIVVKATASRASWIALAENYDPDWRAQVDGKTVPLFRSYGFLTALPVPAGTHEIVLEYRPRSSFAGACALGLSGALSVAAAFALP